MSTDKIFDNTFDESDYDGMSVNWKPDSKWLNNKESDSSIIDNMLMEKIHDLINDSKFSYLNETNENGKLPNLNKNQIREVYNYVVNKITDYNIIEIFSALSEYFDIQGQKFYNSISNSQKDKLMTELDKRTNVIERRGIKRLF